MLRGGGRLRRRTGPLLLGSVDVEVNGRSEASASAGARVSPSQTANSD